jgi:hypothetical protein
VGGFTRSSTTWCHRCWPEPRPSTQAELIAQLKR